MCGGEGRSRKLARDVFDGGCPLLAQPKLRRNLIHMQLALVNPVHQTGSVARDAGLCAHQHERFTDSDQVIIIQQNQLSVHSYRTFDHDKNQSCAACRRSALRRGSKRRFDRTNSTHANVPYAHALAKLAHWLHSQQDSCTAKHQHHHFSLESNTFTTTTAISISTHTTWLLSRTAQIYSRASIP